MTDPILRFLPNEAGEKEGLGDAGIETFRDTPYASCAREAGQNSRDAAKERPVRITFNIRRVGHDEFPSYAELRDAIESCRAEASQDREIAFFDNAADVIGKSRIPVLEIADSNTTGLTGPPNHHGTPFHSLVKATGVTVKSDADAGGSFGIGKNASFAVSDLQTVLYSSVYEDPECGNEAFAAQGKVKLVSHTGADNDPRRATGYWGNPKRFSAVTSPSQVPDWMRRSTVGTTIFCMGFRESEDWAERMTYSLVSNFFCAVHRQEMNFEVDSGRIAINKNTLENLLERDDIKSAAENTGHLADLEFAGQLYRCLRFRKRRGGSPHPRVRSRAHSCPHFCRGGNAAADRFHSQRHADHGQSPALRTTSGAISGLARFCGIGRARGHRCRGVAQAVGESGT